MAATEMYYARRPFAYGRGDVALDPGQVVRLVGEKNDSKLIEYGHVVPFDNLGGRITPVRCNRCGASFIDASSVQAHGIKRHPERARDAIAELNMLEQEDRMLSRTAPLRERLDSIEVTTPLAQAVKRGRGRPKKVDAVPTA